jgi:DNA-directed RNA polymerase specialized sigma24 family protein
MMGLMAEPMLAERTEPTLLRDFGAWMASEQRRIYALCQRFLQDRDEADSATQDVFLKAYQALKREDAKELDDPARWVTRIAVNTCLDRLRSRKWQFWRRRPSSEDERTILSMAA